jgi:hypothetical protein
MRVILERVKAKELKAGDLQTGLPNEPQDAYRFGVWGLKVVLMEIDGKELPERVAELWCDRVRYES